MPASPPCSRRELPSTRLTTRGSLPAAPAGCPARAIPAPRDELPLPACAPEPSRRRHRVRTCSCPKPYLRASADSRSCARELQEPYFPLPPESVSGRRAPADPRTEEPTPPAGKLSLSAADRAHHTRRASGRGSPSARALPKPRAPPTRKPTPAFARRAEKRPKSPPREPSPKPLLDARVDLDFFRAQGLRAQESPRALRQPRHEPVALLADCTSARSRSSPRRSRPPGLLPARNCLGPFFRSRPESAKSD